MAYEAAVSDKKWTELHEHANGMPAPMQNILVTLGQYRGGNGRQVKAG